ncbi:DUF4136 domain-containing protein [Rufibacter psychrotolerans]|uniref:DUF4136 domain-containing protein n=1 Tax=Rufibacter psychrotolerans TaxID=2812556 RepID=UPI001966EC4E|nr:DUF4136 domain-containing protein [Rufibacter sp. SYSU D00308]
MRLKWIAICLTLLAFNLGACNSVRVVNTNAAQDFNLGKYQTFSFMEVTTSADTAGIPIPPEYVNSLKQEITRQLAQRGLRPSESNADLQVNVGVVVQEKTQTRQTDIRTDPPFYMGQRRYTWKSREVEVGRYKEGTVSVHLVDRASNELVWSAEAESVIPDKAEKVQERISEGMEKLFSALPAAGTSAK